MTDLATAEPATPSTVLDTDAGTPASGAGEPRVIADEPVKEPSLRDTIAAATKEAEPKDEPAKPDANEAKEAPPEKAQEAKADDDKGDGAEKAEKAPQRAPDGKFAAKDGEPVEAKAAEPKAEKPTGHIEAPRNFLPDAKETWRNTPRAVQRDVQNAIQQHEQEVARYRETAERYEPLRQYDDLVRQNGRAGLHETLAEVAQLEDMVAKNPVAALNQVLLRAGPRKSDGSPISLFELAQHIVNSGQDNYSRMAAPPAPQPQQQSNAEVDALKKQIADMQQQQLASTVIEPFKAAHPRYEELRDDIAFFLQSGKIPASLSPSERLAAAYDMAARINPASHVEDAPAAVTSPEPRDRVADDSSGSKSIKSAPGAVSADLEPDRGGSIRDLLAAEMKRARRA